MRVVMVTAQVISGILGFILALGLVPLVGRLARDYSLLDIPDAGRRRHAAPTPRLGGIAFFVATLLAACLVLVWESVRGQPIPTGPLWPGVLIGAVIVLIIGILDDVRGVVPLVKVIAHSTAAMVVIAYGFHIDAITLAGNRTFELGNAGIPLTILWIVGLTNAFNLIDGVDGLAATFAMIGLGVAIAVEVIIDPLQPLIVTTAALGALLAFSRFNRAPAKIFLGDCGSTTLGFFLSIQLVLSATNADHVTFAVIPLFALAYPITDTAVAIARRWLRGHPFSRADGRHIHHQILALGLSPRRTVDLLSLIFMGVAVTGVSIAFAPPRVTLVLALGGAVLLFTIFVYGVRWLGYHEFMEFGSSVASVLLNARQHVQNKIVAGDIAASLSKAGSLDEVKAILTGCAEDLGFLEVSLEPAAGHFVGPTFRQISPLADRPFRIDCPIAWEHADGQVQEAVLRFWFERPTGFRHMGTERIISRLAPAVQLWMRANTPVYGVPVVQPVAQRRTSGPSGGRHVEPGAE
jgi:UDP-GlcNAc:undecaprenyl-phosphate/decaprenyl-phosphate GlcNAc-1-phosphate transferase